MVNQRKYHKITILSGGTSKEREVSQSSGVKSYDALINAGYDVSILDPEDDRWVQNLLDNRPDAVLNMLHGRYGEDGVIQGMLESFKIPYSHSGVEASAVAMNKHYTKLILAQHGLPVPHGFIAKPADIYKILREKVTHKNFSLPFVIKPISEGSSVDMIISRDLDKVKFENLSTSMQSYSQLMIEEFISGRELTVSVVNNKPLTVTEITTKNMFYDYQAKYAQGGSRHIIPANIPKKDFDLAMSYALKAHHILGCKGVTRTDFRYCLGDSPAMFVLEINTQPGMTPTSLVPEQAEFLGMSYQELVVHMVEDASCNR